MKHTFVVMDLVSEENTAIEHGTFNTMKEAVDYKASQPAYIQDQLKIMSHDSFEELLGIEYVVYSDSGGKLRLNTVYCGRTSADKLVREHYTDCKVMSMQDWEKLENCGKPEGCVKRVG